MTSANQHVQQVYRCDTCEEEYEKYEMITKRVGFSRAGFKGEHIKSRTVAQLCVSCVKLDPHWNTPDARGKRA